MTVTPKRLVQVAQSSVATVRFTSFTGTTTQITEIYLANTGSTERIVTLYHGGTSNANTILDGIIVPANGSVRITDAKIVLAPGVTFAAKQDAGTDIIMTLFGVEEVA